MQPRRSLRLVAGALLLTSPLLASCGFGKATDQPYTPGEGINYRDGDVKVLSAVVVSAQPGSGTFIASFTNNGEEETAFEGLEGAGEWSAALTAEEVDPPVELAADRGFANLAEGGGVPLTGDFDPGDVLSLTLSFAGGTSITMDAPVVFACEEYTGLDTSGSAPTSSEGPTPSEEPTEEPSVTESASAGEDESEEPSETGSAETEPTETETSAAPDSAAEDGYDCSVAHEDHGGE